jgi:hypothetical protein
MKTGLICDNNFKELVLFDNFRYAITGLYPDIIDVYSAEDLSGLDILFIPHPNHGSNMQICARTGFIERCNELGITLVIFFSEKIGIDKNKKETLYLKGLHDEFLNYFESLNPILFKDVYSDEDCKFRLFSHLKKANKVIIYAYDVDDCKAFNLKLFRVGMSKYFKYLGDYIPFSERLKSIGFCGSHYKTRVSIIKIIPRNISIPCNFIKTNFKSWYAYMAYLAQYQFILSPFGNANGFVSRFYEALTLKSIVIQQVNSNTLQYYDKEAQFKNCIFFENPEEIPSLINEYVIPEERGELWLEDILSELLQEDNLL